MKRILAVLALTLPLSLSSAAFADDVTGSPHGASRHGAPHGAPANTEVAEGGAHEGGHEHGGAPGAINWFDFGNTEQRPFIYAIINFAVLLAIYVHFGKKPVAEGLKNRRAAVAKEIEEAKRMKEEAEERAKMYQAKLANLEGELEATRKALMEAGRGDRDRIVQEAEEKAVRMQKDAQFMIEQELKQFRQDLLTETVMAASQAAEELLRKKITPADHERLAEEYLAELGARKSAHGGVS